jgi:hypothetical protein
MSEANVNSISGLGTAGIKINSPVGINTNPTSDGLTILGHVSVVNSSAEVVTVTSENFGVKIKGSSGTPNTFTRLPSVLQFADKAGVKRACVSSTADKIISFESGITGPIMTDASSPTGGIFISNSNSELISKAVFGGTAGFVGQANFDYSYMPSCGGIARNDDELINLNLFNQWILNTTTLKTWSTFGTLDNGGIKMGKRTSNNFFVKLGLWGKGEECCCGCQTLPGAYNQGAYNELLTGKWLVIGFSRSQRSCSCSDNEQAHFPIDSSNVWTLTNDTIKNTIPAKLSGTYDLFGFAIRPLDVDSIVR